MQSIKRNIQPLPFPAYFIPIVVCAVVGLIASGYLSISHYRVYTDIGYKSFCAVSRAINCDTVSQSPFSIFLDVPVPVWGVVGYIIILVLLIKAWQYRYGKKYIWPTIVFISLIYSAYSIILALISSIIIKSYCIMCILTYAVNFLLVFLSWLVFKRFENETLFDGLKNDIRKYSNNMKFTSSFVIACVIIFIGVPMVFPAYWNMGINTSFRDVPTGITEDGHPWIGSEDPQVTIIEYSDYQCFQCKKMHLFLRQLIVEYPESIRLVHLHFPMDHAFNPIVKEPFHVGSGKLALLAIFSEIRGKFWEMNDTLFNLGNVTDTIKIGEISDLTGLNAKELAASIDNAYIKKRLKIDIWDGIRRGVTGTPSYIINGQLYLGELPSHVFSKIQ